MSLTRRRQSGRRRRSLTTSEWPEGVQGAMRHEHELGPSSDPIQRCPVHRAPVLASWQTTCMSLAGRTQKRAPGSLRAHSLGGDGGTHLAEVVPRAGVENGQVDSGQQPQEDSGNPEATPAAIGRSAPLARLRPRRKDWVVTVVVGLTGVIVAVVGARQLWPEVPSGTAMLIALPLVVGLALWWRYRTEPGAMSSLGGGLLAGTLVAVAVLAVEAPRQAAVDHRSLQVTLGLQRDLTFIDLTGRDLSGLYLRGKVLNFASMRQAILDRADLREAKLAQADMRAARLRWADLTGADLPGAEMRKADLRDARLPGADLSEADLAGAHLSRSELFGAALEDANLRTAVLRDANLNHLNVAGADLTDADLSRAGMVEADLSYATLVRANMRDADLRGADLRYADLSRADLLRANLRGALANSCTRWPVGFEPTQAGVKIQPVPSSECQ